MKILIIFSLLLTVSSAAYSNDYYGPRIHFMPMPDQYKNYSEYRDALEIWKSVAMKRQYDPYRHYYYYGGTMTSMPKPDQYKNSSEYRDALEIWRRVAIKQNPIIVQPMPMPDQYKNYSEYRDALSLWQQVYGR
jgi:hypothetical protein